MASETKYPRLLKLANERFIKVEGMSAYWCAVALADCFSEKELKAAGISFDNAQKRGPEILAAMEKILEAKHAKMVANAEYFKSRRYNPYKYIR